ncbi:MAG: hypothetical protein ABFS35_20485 [Bacteroidota bacterium]
MTTLNEKEKRDFVEQVIVILEQQASEFITAGFDPANRTTGLKEKKTTADEAEGRQKEAQAAAIDATKLSNVALKAAYSGFGSN